MNNTPDVYQGMVQVSHSIDWVNWVVSGVLQDPFYEAKKKCLPHSLDWLDLTNEYPIRENIAIFSTLPFSCEDMLWYSFRDSTLNNLILDWNGTLLKMILQVSIGSEICPNQAKIKTTEIRWATGKLLARKFDSYI